MAKAERAILDECEGALRAAVVVDKLKELRDQAGELRRRGRVDASAVRAEVDRIKAEISRLVDLAAKGGSLDEVHAGIRDRKARLEHAEGKLLMVSGKVFDYADVRDAVQEVLDVWKTNLRRPAAKAVLAKLLPHRLTVTPTPQGGWRFTGPANYEGLLEDAGVDLESMHALLDEIVPRRRRSKTSKTPTSAGCPPPTSPQPSAGKRSRRSRWSTRCSRASTPSRS
jgi:hypothetical protein